MVETREVTLILLCFCCITVFAVPTPQCDYPGFRWTRYFDRDDPSGSCDCELFANLRSENPGQICANPREVDARVKSLKLDYRATGQVVTVNEGGEKGLRCNNDDNPYGCHDYEIRFCCDYDECQDDPCHEHATCTNTIGGYTCACKAGFVGNGFHCDIPAPVCPRGYSWSKFFNRDDPTGNCDCETHADLRKSHPLLVCANPHIVDARLAANDLDYRVAGQKVTIATSKEKAFRCDNKDNKNGCFDYKVRFCCDVDECASSPCHANARCTNTPGSFRCQCNSGYFGDGYKCVPIPTCSRSGYDWTQYYDRDDPSGSCDCETFSDLRRQYPEICSSPTAIQGRVKSSGLDYRLTGQNVIAGTAAEKGLRCNNADNVNRCLDYEIRFCCDVDECASSPCDVNADCTNSPGSFSCVCKPGYTGDGFQCVSIPTCSRSGFKWTGYYDRDDPSGSCDCETFSDLRRENSGEICSSPTAIQGRVKSSKLDYRLTGQNVIAGTAAEKGLRCNNADNKNKCLDYEIRFCCDVNECASSPCHANARCTNTPGSFRCQCNSGFVGDGFSCYPIPKCSHGYDWTGYYDRDDPSGSCDCETFSDLRRQYPEICSSPTAIQGRVKSSKLDYRLTGQNVIAGTAAEKGLRCNNADNAKRCLDYEIRFCCDIDECASSPCHVNAKCTNLPGSFKCECNEGYLGNGYVCVPKPVCKFPSRWTPFYDRDDPSGTCDCETFADLKPKYKICSHPSAIEGRVKSSKVDYRLAGQNVIAYTATEKGLRCNNVDNKGKCHDYEIRFCCPFSLSIPKFPFGR